MGIERGHITVSGLQVEVVRKAIKNLHLGVYPPHGRVRVAAPLVVSNDAVRLAVIGKLGWIKRQKARFEAQPRQSEREMVSGESHYLWGRRYRLRVLQQPGTPKILADAHRSGEGTGRRRTHQRRARSQRYGH
ncbi:MAG: YgjP-like metallopeptidase domain-containing protein [Planctomycetota bacterium]